MTHLLPIAIMKFSTAAVFLLLGSVSAGGPDINVSVFNFFFPIRQSTIDILYYIFPLSQTNGVYCSFLFDFFVNHTYYM